MDNHMTAFARKLAVPMAGFALAVAGLSAQAAKPVSTFERVGVVVAVDATRLTVRATQEDAEPARFRLPPEAAGNVRDGDDHRVTLRPGQLISFYGDRTATGRMVRNIRVLRPAATQSQGGATQ